MDEARLRLERMMKGVPSEEDVSRFIAFLERNNIEIPSLPGFVPAEPTDRHLYSSPMFYYDTYPDVRLRSSIIGEYMTVLRCACVLCNDGNYFYCGCYKHIKPFIRCTSPDTGFTRYQYTEFWCRKCGVGAEKIRRVISPDLDIQDGAIRYIMPATIGDFLDMLERHNRNIDEGLFDEVSIK